MLKAELLPPDAYSRIAAQLESEILCHHVHSTLCYFAQGRYKPGEIELRIWRVGDDNSEAIAAFAFVQILLEKQMVFHVAATTADPNFLRAAIPTLLEASAGTWSQFPKVMCLHIREDIKMEMERYFTTKTEHSHIPHDVPVCGFYSTPRQIQWLLRSQTPPIPSEYEFCSLGDGDAAQLCAEHIYTTAKDEAIIGVRLRRWPSVGIRRNGEIVAYECLDPTGSISMQYTRAAVRRKGLGAAVEFRVCRRKIEETGTRPWKGVSATMFDVLRRSRESPFWTPILRDNGEPWLFHYTQFSQSPD